MVFNKESYQKEKIAAWRKAKDEQPERARRLAEIKARQEANCEMCRGKIVGCTSPTHW